MVDDVEAAVRFEERWGQFLDALVADPELEPVLLPALALGVDFDHLRRVARVLHEHYDRLRSSSASASGVGVSAPAVDLRPVLAPLEQAVARLVDCCVPQDKLAQHIDGLAGWADVLRGATDDLDRLDLLGEMPKFAKKQRGAAHELALSSRRGTRPARAGRRGARSLSSDASSRPRSTCWLPACAASCSATPTSAAVTAASSSTICSCSRATCCAEPGRARRARASGSAFS